MAPCAVAASCSLTPHRGPAVLYTSEVASCSGNLIWRPLGSTLFAPYTDFRTESIAVRIWPYACTSAGAEVAHGARSMRPRVHRAGSCDAQPVMEWAVPLRRLHWLCSATALDPPPGFCLNTLLFELPGGLYSAPDTLCTGSGVQRAYPLVLDFVDVGKSDTAEARPLAQRFDKSIVRSMYSYDTLAKLWTLERTVAHVRLTRNASRDHVGDVVLQAAEPLSAVGQLQRPLRLALPAVRTHLMQRMRAAGIPNGARHKMRTISA